MSKDTRQDYDHDMQAGRDHTNAVNHRRNLKEKRLANKLRSGNFQDWLEDYDEDYWDEDYDPRYV